MVLAMRDERLAHQLFDDAAWARLHRIADVAEGVLREAADVALAKHLEAADILLTGWGAPRLDEEFLLRAPRLAAVVHAAGSVKAMVTRAVWERGIRVSTAAEVNALPVAEYALAMILLLGKRAFEAEKMLRGGHPRSWERLAPLGNEGAVVGVVGASRTGRHLLSLLRPHELDVILFDPTLTAADADALGARLTSLDELLRAADVVSVHAPALPETRGMIGARELALMKDGAALLNTARGSLVDTDALVAELHANRLRAVLDVTEPEPLPRDHALFAAPGVVLTPHIAGAFGNELRRLGAHAVSEVERFASTGTLLEEVLPEALARIA
ncbi:hydroxyacid dehydrogenase [Microbacterium immunditiarum]|uniref:hydroxyacid dehydrogenase n=1 Tax=Microbacterium immunditiarum TaxID=337480 RepID=UPI0031B586F8